MSSFWLLSFPTTTIYSWILTFLPSFFFLIQPYKCLVYYRLQIMHNFCGAIFIIFMQIGSFYLRDGILKATFNWKYTFCKTNPVKWHSSLCSPAKVAMPCGSHNVNTAHAACQLWNSVILEKEFSIHSISIILCYVHKTFIFSLHSFGFAFFTITLIWPYIAWWWGDPFQR